MEITLNLGNFGSTLCFNNKKVSSVTPNLLKILSTYCPLKKCVAIGPVQKIGK